MDFIDNLKQFATRAGKLKEQIQTEEATKTSLIMPFFQQVLGYDVFNPDEFVPEFTADVGIKKGEKVDYAIKLDGKPAILIEAKWCGEALDKHDSQLFRYFGTSRTKFAILTNGIVYKFFTDLEEQNKMDLKPFLELDLLNIKETLIPEVKRFCKSSFDVNEIFSSASELKYSNELKNYFSAQLKEPSDEFILHMITHVYDGKKTQNVIDKFRPIVKLSLNNYISELMSEKITTALKGNNSDPIPLPDSIPVPIIEEVEEHKAKIITTDEEIEGYYLVKAILSEKFDSSKVTYKDTTNYFSINFDGFVTKWICRLWLNSNRKSLILPGENKQQITYEMDNIHDLFKYRAELEASAAKYMDKRD
ncbi:MAG: type I restriction enzyme HsdR N-terminal domain-containing protein [Spirochaetia bacterium]|jgi:hypothetical protein|nr:type I restriction enzyme HsdR N-terminal domain-containing protein [Spirochaetia bacterium]